MTDIFISARRGAGAPAEILYGTVTFKPTLAHSRSTSIVLPAPTTFDLVDGEVVATNVQPTPEPVEGQIEWAYEVTFRDRHSKTYSFLVGVPDNTTQVNFTSLPRYFETKPPLFGQGPQGVPGEAATVAVGTVSSGTSAQVTNSGTNTDAVLNFTLPRGDKGDKGDGVPTGGSALQYIRKNAGNTATEWASLDKASVGLGNVDNTSDANKPVSTAQKTYIDRSTTLPGRSKSFADAPNTYPLGTSTTIVSPAEDWPQSPEGSSSVMQLTTQRNASNNGGVTQYISPWNAPEAPLKYRVSKSDNTWGEFYTLAKDDGTFANKGDGGTILAKDYGAVGDGVVNDYWTIQRAITYAKGREIILEGGKTYLIGGTLKMPTNSRSVTIRTPGAEPAVLLLGADGQSYPAIDFDAGDPVVVAQLSASIGINQKGWHVASATGVSKGMLCEVISNKSWYHDPRPESAPNDARKSELHRVQYVQGNTVYMDDAANDGYNIAQETVELRFYNPIKVILENITIRGKLPPIAEESKAVQGLVISGADRPEVIKVNAEYCARTGVSIARSYEPRAIGGYTRGANNYWNGYGLVIRGCAHALVDGRYTYESKKGVDVTGFNCISRHTIVQNCKTYGGGVNSRGNNLGWNPDGSFGTQQSGFGNHGAADNTTYRFNTVIDVWSPFGIRGRNTYIHDNLIMGRTTGGAVRAYLGTNLFVTNNRIISGYWSLKDANSYTDANIDGMRADTIVTVYDTWQSNPASGIRRGQLVVSGNIAELRTAVVRMHMLHRGEMSITNNRVLFMDTNLPRVCYVLDNNSGEDYSPGSAGIALVIGPNDIRTPSNDVTYQTSNRTIAGARILEYTTAT